MNPPWRLFRAVRRGPFERARLRLAAYYVLILACILLAFDVAVISVLGRNLESDLEQELQHRAQQAATAIVGVSGGGLFNRNALATPDWADISVYASTSNGTIIQSANPLSRTVLPDAVTLSTGLVGRSGLSEVNAAKQHFLVYTQPIYRRDTVGGPAPVVVGVVQVARSTSAMDDALRELTTVVVAASALALGLAFIAGVWLADKALSPVREALLRQTDFVSDASHELRTPVTVIRTAAESIVRLGAVSPRVRALADDIVSETAQLGNLVGDLAELARADSRAGMRMEAIDAAALLESIADAGAHLATSRDVSLTPRIDVAGQVDGDEVRLRQLFAILLDNATKFAPAGSSVEFTATHGPRRLVVSVVDQGPGIPAAELPRIFERFFRGSAERQNEGSGLGLSIAQWIVAEHGGRITVRSTEGRGAEFTVELPLHAATQGAPRPEG